MCTIECNLVYMITNTYACLYIGKYTKTYTSKRDMCTCIRNFTICLRFYVLVTFINASLLNRRNSITLKLSPLIKKREWKGWILYDEF